MKITSFTPALIFFSFTLVVSKAQPDVARFVNPFIGTGGHGHTFPGALVPFGMVQLSPDTRIDGSWDGCSGYHYSDSIIYGFSHTHLSGTGISDYGDIMLMPTVGIPVYAPNEYSSTFSHTNEIASAGYYSVKLDNGVSTELTATKRVGIHKYSFPKSMQANLLLDIAHRDECLETEIKIESATRITGFRRSSAWAKDQYIAFVMEFSKPMKDFTVSENKIESKSKVIKGTKSKINFTFDNDGVTPLLVKVAISHVGVDGADANLQSELNHWDFYRVKKEAETLWNKELSKIEVTSTDTDKLSTFYTALYHCFTHPATASDVDGRYRGIDNKIHKADNYTHYTVFSLWDTFRALHPLLTIVERDRTNDFIQSFLSMYKQGGRLPVWELASNETDCMIGYHSVSVIADAAVKGIRNFDTTLALEAMVKSATWPHLGLPAYQVQGVITADDDAESVSKTLEYAYDDWCIAEFAKLLGNESIANQFSHRSLYYRNTFDASTGFMRPKKNGNWLSPFDPREVNNYFTEANSWQYSLFVPHDIMGHINLLGGVLAYEKKLDDLFSSSSETTGREQADITGLIGQYAHGNEPSHHMAYLYNYINKSGKTQEKVHYILNNLYHNQPDGLSGNEDCGQMSAWYVLSSLGLYQVTPGSKNLDIGSPSFSKAIIHLENGNDFTINASNNAIENPYIASAMQNGVSHKKSFIKYDELLKGGDLTFDMTREITHYFTESPVSLVTDKLFVPTPLIHGSLKSFKTEAKIELSPTDSNTIYYTADNTEPTEKSLHYSSPISITNTSVIKAIAIEPTGHQSKIAQASFYKFPNDYDVTLVSEYTAQYHAGGKEGIIDGIRGDGNWRKGEWQGYQKQNFEVLIDLKKQVSIQEFGAGFLQDTRSWILMPTKVDFEVSKDGKKFTPVASVINSVDPRNYDVVTKDFTTLVKKQKVRFVKVKAYNFGKLPEWHQGYPFGGDAFIFVDEVWVK